MGVRFNQWPAQLPSICFLRQVLTSESFRISHSRGYDIPTGLVYSSGRHVSTFISAVTEQEDKRDGSEQSAKSLPSIVEAAKARADSFTSPPHPHEASGYSCSTALSSSSFRVFPREHRSSVKQPLRDSFSDEPEDHDDFKSWVELLEKKKRLEGFDGVRHIWIRMRRLELELPTTGEEADVLWESFILAGISWDREARYRVFYDEVIAYARGLKARGGTQYDGLLQCVVGGWVRSKPELARQFYKSLILEFDAPDDLLRRLAKDFAYSRNSTEAQKCFRRIHMIRAEHGLYDKYMSEVLQMHSQIDALAWHRTLLRRGEGPSQDFLHNQKTQELMELDEDQSLPIIHRRPREANVSESGAAQYREHFPPLNRASMSALVGDVHGIKPRDFSDQFVARIFATQAFSLDLVVRGMSLLGIDTLGPLSLRELALRARVPSVFCGRLEELQIRGVEPDNSPYSRLIQQLAAGGESALFQTLLASDQHPEEYGNAPTQEKLLEMYLSQGEWLSVHVTLSALSTLGPRAHQRSWNRLLQHNIRSRDAGSTVAVMKRMQVLGYRLDKRTLNFMRRLVLPSRSAGKAPEDSVPVSNVMKPLQFTTRAYMYAAQKGTRVDPTMWKEILKRYGMARDWDSVERLTVWLVTHYSVVKKPHVELRQILTRQMCQAIVIWGFRAAGGGARLGEVPSQQDTPSTDVRYDPKATASRSEAEREAWAQGLVLLQRLPKLGFKIHSSVIRESFTNLMWILFGPAFSLVEANRMAIRHNRHSLARYVQHANKLWNGRLFDIHPDLLHDQPETNAKLVRALFGPRRRVSKSRDEYADVDVYARSISSPDRHRPHTGLVPPHLAYRIWRNSPMRLPGRRGPSRSALNSRIASPFLKPHLPHQ